MVEVTAKAGDVVWLHDDCDVIKLRYDGQNEWGQAILRMRAPNHITVTRDKLLKPDERRELNKRLEFKGDR